MPRTYSFDHFQAKKPQQSVVGTPERLGNDEDKQVPLKSELPDTHQAQLPQDAGGIHYGMKHAETVKRLQARRAKRAQQEAQGRGKAAAKRPTGKRAAGTGTEKKATGTEKKATAKKASGTKATGTAAKKSATGTQRTAAKKSTQTEAAEPAATAKAPRGGTLSRLVGAVMKGTKGVVREGALAKAVRLGKNAAAQVGKTAAAKVGRKPAGRTKDK